MGCCSFAVLLEYRAHPYFAHSGFTGKHPGPEIDDCFLLDLTDGGPGVWSRLPSLPAPRGGGTMSYIPNENSLVFALGAVRPSIGSPEAIDHSDAWILSLEDIDEGWRTLPELTYEANHVVRLSQLFAIRVNKCEFSLRFSPTNRVPLPSRTVLATSMFCF